MKERAFALFFVTLIGAGVVLGATRRLTWEDSTAAVSGGEKISSLRLHGKVLSGVDLRTGQRLSDDYTADFSAIVELPNRYLRVVDGPLVAARTGFAGTAPIWSRTFKNGATPTSSSTQVREGYVAEQRALFQRLLVGELAASDRELGLVAAPEGQSSFHVTGPGDLDCHVDVDSAGIPVRVRYQTPWQFFIQKAGTPQADVSRQKAEMVIEFSDRRQVGKARLAYRIVSIAHSLVGGLTAFNEDIVLDRVEMNPHLSSADFN